jgi:hypothetical protein
MHRWMYTVLFTALCLGSTPARLAQAQSLVMEALILPVLLTKADVNLRTQLVPTGSGQWDQDCVPIRTTLDVFDPEASTTPMHSDETTGQSFSVFELSPLNDSAVFDGKYYIAKVTHTLPAAGAWDCRSATVWQRDDVYITSYSVAGDASAPGPRPPAGFLVGPLDVDVLFIATLVHWPTCRLSGLDPQARIVVRDEQNTVIEDYRPLLDTGSVVSNLPGGLTAYTKEIDPQGIDPDLQALTVSLPPSCAGYTVTSSKGRFVNYRPQFFFR